MFGNRTGIDLLQEKASFHILSNVLDEESRWLKKKKTDSESKITHTRTYQSFAASNVYVLTKQTFLDTLRRDVPKNPAANHTPMVQAGNVAAHDGDAITDISKVSQPTHRADRTGR